MRTLVPRERTDEEGTSTQFWVRPGKDPVKTSVETERGKECWKDEHLEYPESRPIVSLPSRTPIPNPNPLFSEEVIQTQYSKSGQETEYDTNDLIEPF